MDADRLKRRLKDWEARFVRKYGRKPTKTDILARPHVADAYRDYGKARKAPKPLSNTSASAAFLDLANSGAGNAAPAAEEPSKHHARKTLVASAAVSTSAEFISSPFTGKGGRIHHGVVHPRSGSSHTPSSTRIAFVVEDVDGNTEQVDMDLLKTPTHKARREALPTSGSAGARTPGAGAPGSGGHKLLAAFQACTPAAQRSADFVGPSPAKAPRLGRGPVAPAPLPVAQSAAASKRRESEPSLSFGELDLADGDYGVGGRSHNPLAPRSRPKTPAGARKPSILNQIPAFFRRHPRAISSVKDDIDSMPGQSSTTDSASLERVVSNHSVTNRINVDMDDTFGPSLNKPLYDASNRAQPSLAYAEDHDDDVENNHADDRHLIHEIANNLPQRRAPVHGNRPSEEATHPQPKLSSLQTTKPSKPIETKPPSTDDAPDQHEPSVSLLPVIRPNKFVNARIIKRESSKAIDIPENYQEFLSEQEQRLFADVIRDARGHKSHPHSDPDGMVDGVTDANAVAGPSAFDGCDDNNVGTDRQTGDASHAENSADSRSNKLASDQATSSRSKRVLHNDNNHNGHIDDFMDMDPISGPRNSAKRRKDTSDGNHSDDAAPENKLSRPTVSHWTSSTASKSKNKSNGASTSKLASSNFRALKMRSKASYGRSSASSWRGGRSRGSFRKGGSMAGSRSRSWTTKAASEPRHVQNAFGELEQIESQARLNESIREPVDVLPGTGSGSISAAQSSTCGVDIDFIHVDDEDAKPEWTCATFGSLDRPAHVDVDLALKRMCGLETFRSGQREAIVRILQGKSTLIVLPTGGGKSLCYQLPAFVLRHIPHAQPCLTLVVSPTISLMLDQMRCLPASLRAACLSSAHQSASASRDVYNRLEAGEIDVLFVAPERLRSASFLDRVRSGKIPPVRLVCVDEAHCLSEWSHNFRTSYLHMRDVLRTVLHVKCIVALTATATIQTRSSICQMLDIDPMPYIMGDEKDDSACGGVISIPAVRSNILISASKVSDDDERDEALLRLLRSRDYRNLDSIIIYVMFQAQADRLAQFLRIRDFDADSYHAGKSSELRDQVQTRFLRSKLRIVVATVAFGLGINKQNVRSVIHYALPKSVEDYVQEVGRCGRDGLPAYGHLFLVKEDYVRQRSFAFSDGLDEAVVWRLLIGIFGDPGEPVADEWEEDEEEIEQDDDDEELGDKSPELLPPSSPTHPTLENDTEMSLGAAHNGDSDEQQASTAVRRMIIPIDELEQDLDARESVIATLLSGIEFTDMSEVSPTSNACRRNDGKHSFIQVHPILNSVYTIYASKARLELLAETSELIKHAIKIGHSVSHGIEFNTLNLAESLEIAPQDLASELWRLQRNNRSIKCVGTRRAFHISIHWSSPGYESGASRSNKNDTALHQRQHHQLLKRLQSKLVARMQRLEDAAVHKLDQLYEMMYGIVPEVSYDDAPDAASSAQDQEDESSNSVSFAVTAQKALMERIRLYFESSDAMESSDNASAQRWGFRDPEIVERQRIAKAHVEISIKEFVHAHAYEVSSGRAVARIFHGLSSPKYQAKEWSQNKHWNSFPFYNFKGLANLADKALAIARIRTKRSVRGKTK